MINICSSYQSRMENENENETSFFLVTLVFIAKKECISKIDRVICIRGAI